MVIDWFTVGAQALNFLILVWLLKRFLYKPILDALDAREKRIANELADADAKRADAEKEREELRRKNEEFDQQRGELLNRATEQAKAERQRLLEEARRAAEDLRARRQEALEREHQNLNDEIVSRTREEVFAIAGKALTDLAGTSLEQRMTEVFIRRLRELDGEAKDNLAKALTTNSEPVLVHSALELPAEQRAAIQRALDETFSPKTKIQFETAPQAISGIELTAQGRRIAWSIADYLASLERNIGGFLKTQDQSRTDPKETAIQEAK